MDTGEFGAWLGVVIAVGGFSATLVQLARTKRSADAASEAVARTSRQLAAARLAAVANEMRRDEDDLRKSVLAGDRDRAVDSLRSWQDRAAELRGIMRVVGSDTQSLDGRIRTAVLHADTAMEALGENEAETREATARAREAIAAAAREITTVTSRSQYSIDGDHTGDS